MKARLSEYILRRLSDNPLHRLFKNRILCLKTLGLHITTTCNYNCTYCYAENYKNNRLSLERMLALIDEARSLGAECVNLLGGEPLLNKDLDKIIFKIERNHMRLMIFTNGSLITDSWIRSLKKIKNVVLVIKYDYDENIYSAQTRSKYPLKLIEENIRKSVENKIPVITFTVVTKQNLCFVDTILSRSVRLGAFPKLHPYIPIRERSKQLNEELEISAIEWGRVLRKVSYVYLQFEKLIYALGKFKFGLCSCFVHNLYITIDGYALPCPESPIELNLGNIMDSSLSEIWNRFTEKRAEWLKVPSECANCKNEDTCFGGCKVYTYFRFKDFNKKDPLCAGEIPTTYSHCVYALQRILPNKPSYKLLRIINEDHSTI